MVIGKKTLPKILPIDPAILPMVAKTFDAATNLEIDPKTAPTFFQKPVKFLI